MFVDLRKFSQRRWSVEGHGNFRCVYLYYFGFVFTILEGGYFEIWVRMQFWVEKAFFDIRSGWLAICLWEATNERRWLCL